MAKRVRDASIMAPRLATSSRRLLPDYLVIGAQKAGTTSLYYYLLEHPDVGPSLREEVHFFDNAWDRGLGWYRAHFPLARARRRFERANGRSFLVGEATPYYLFHPHAPRRIAETVPSARLIVLLRNPVDRAYSHYNHEVRLGNETLDFEAALDAESERLEGEVEHMLRDQSYRSHVHQHASYLARGLYADQLSVWRDLFPAQQLLVLDAASFQSDTGTVFDRILEFLGLRAWRPDSFPRHNAWSYPKMQPSTRARLLEHYRPHNDRLFADIDQRFDWDR